MPVKSPMTKTTRCPRSWKCFILRSTTVCPRCRSGAEGSKPTFTVSGEPAFCERASLASRSSGRMMSTAPLRRYSSCSCGGAKRVLGAAFLVPGIVPSAAGLILPGAPGEVQSAHRFLEQPLLLQADEAAPADDQMVVQADPHQLPGTGDGARELNVVAARIETAAGVVVRQHEGQRRVHDRRLQDLARMGDRKSTRLNSSHSQISYAVFCLKKKKNKIKHNEHVERPERLRDST